MKEHLTVLSWMHTSLTVSFISYSSKIVHAPSTYGNKCLLIFLLLLLFLIGFLYGCRHLTELAKKGGEPLNFEFVEYHKVCLVLKTFYFSDALFLIISNSNVLWGMYADTSVHVYFDWGSRECVELGWRDL